MAESLNSGKNFSASDDDMIRQALKAGLEHFEASDELMRKTLDKCTAELEKTSRPKTLFGNIFKGPALRYCATVAAACLLLIVIVKFPVFFGNRAATDSNSTNRTQTAADAGGAEASQPGAAAPALSKSANNYSVEATPSAEPAPSVELAPGITAVTGEGQANDVTIMFSESVSSLNSLNNNGNEKHRGNEAKPVDAFNAVVSTYNRSNGTKLSCDAARALTVSTVTKDGITSGILRNTSDYHQIIGAYDYWILPLQNDQGEIVTLLPVFETNPSDGSGNNYDISVTYGGENWLSSQAFSINADRNTLDLMLDRNTLEKLVQSITGINNITEILIADINNGRDFLALITADGKEYAVPLFTTIKADSLSNGQLYSIREALDGLAGYLDSQNP